jgi:ubiquinone/menaquinone biosynthesis C-methylase UbiE
MKNIKSEAEFGNRWKEELEEVYRDQLGLPDWEQRVVRKMKEDYTPLIEEIEKYKNLKGKKLLDLGCGWGFLFVPANAHGAIVFGIDPKKERAKISKMRLAMHGIDANLFSGIGENLPFKDDTFDVIHCSSVLEHVQDPLKVIDEMIRILKPGGLCKIRAPNYLFPYEPHYKLFWIQFLPRTIAKLYLRLRGRPTPYLNEINYTTYFLVHRHLRKLDVEIINLQEERIRNPKLIKSRWRRFIAKMIKISHTTWIMNLLSPSISLVVVKKSSMEER